MDIKKLFVTRKNEEEEDSANLRNEIREEQSTRITYYQTGYGAALKAGGSALNFRACLENVYASFEQQCREQEIE